MMTFRPQPLPIFATDNNNIDNIVINEGGQASFGERIGLKREICFFLRKQRHQACEVMGYGGAIEAVVSSRRAARGKVGWVGMLKTTPVVHTC